MQILLWLCLVTASALAPASAAEPESCETRIGRFEVEGNEVTQAQYLIHWSKLLPGQRLDADDIERARQEIFDYGLFLDVDVSIDNKCTDDATVIIRVREKYYQLFYPRLSRNANGVIEKGWKYEGNNLFGAGHSLEARISEKDYESGATAEEKSINYKWSMLTKPYDFRISAHRSSSLVEGSNDISQIDDRFSFLVGRDWLSNPIGHPVSVLLKTDFQHRYWDQAAPVGTPGLGHYSTLGLRLEYDDVHEEKYRRYGRFFGLELNRGFYELGSDFDTAHFSLEAMFYHRLNTDDNLNTRLILSLASEDVFDDPNYSFGGAYSLRGIDSGEISGNGLWQANIEYLHGFEDHPNFRLALFTDIGNIFQDYTDTSDDNWLQTYGIGLRWKLQSFVHTTLVIDYSYDPDSGSSKIYGGTSLIF